jgi:gluconolactonase
MKLALCRPFLVLATSALAIPCSAQTKTEMRTLGKIDVYDPSLENLLDPNAPIEILADGFTWTEGPVWIGSATDDKILYVAQSDPKQAIWMAFDVKPDGTLETGKILLDVTNQVGAKPGLPDGMSVDDHGNLWASGPGGIFVISPQGKALGRITTNEKTSNCCFGEDGSTLFMTVDSYLCRVKTKSHGSR